MVLLHPDGQAPELNVSLKTTVFTGGVDPLNVTLFPIQRGTSAPAFGVIGKGLMTNSVVLTPVDCAFEIVI